MICRSHIRTCLYAGGEGATPCLETDSISPRSVVLGDRFYRSVFPTPTISTRLTRAGFVDRERAIVERAAIEGRNGGFGLIGIRHFHEPETA
jgi:hypothetical protein